MARYKIDIEIPKITNAFRKVKEDMDKLYEMLNESLQKQSEQKELIMQLTHEIETLKLKTALNNYPKEEKEEEEIVGNIESKKFHYASCPFAKNIRDTNKINFNSIEKAVKNGYNECACIREA